MKKLTISDWHIIDKKKEEKILNLGDDMWGQLAINAGYNLDEYGNFVGNFNWEEGFKCGLPYKSGKYLAKVEDDLMFEDGIYFLEYDDDYELHPCFTLFPAESDNPHIFWPIAWAEILEQ